MRVFWKAIRRLVFGDKPVSGQPGSSVLRRAGQSPAKGRLAVAAGSEERKLAMNDLYQQLLQHFDARDVRYLSHVDTLSLCADFRLDVGNCRVIAAIDADNGLFQVFGYSPVRVPEGARRMIAETISRANYGLRVGKFEMDFADGELRFQASQILAEERLEDEVIGRLMGTTMTMLEIYLPAVMSVIYGNETPEDAVRCAEAAHGGAGRPPADESDESE